MHEAGFDTLKAWENFLDAPELTAYLLYPILKLVMFFTFCYLYCRRCCPQCCRQYCPRCYRRCCRRCYCQLSGCNKKGDYCGGKCKSCGSCLWKYTMKLMAKIVDALFGAPLGVIERHKDEYKINDEDEHEIQTLYIRKNSMTYADVTILAMVTLTFLLVIFTSFWDRFWIDESNNCVIDPETYCYPIPIHPESRASLNIPESANRRIDNCSMWQDLNTAGKITFRCFKFAYNLGDALGAVGGLTTIFTVTTRLITRMMITLAKCIKDQQSNVNKSIDTKCDGDSSKSDDGRTKCCRCCSQCLVLCCLCNCYKKQNQETGSMSHPIDSSQYPTYNTWILRVILSVLLLLMDTSASIIISFFYFVDIIFGYQNHVFSNMIFRNVFKNLNKLVLPFGVISTILLLPFERYTDSGESTHTEQPVIQTDHKDENNDIMVHIT